MSTDKKTAKPQAAKPKQRKKKGAIPEEPPVVYRLISTLGLLVLCFVVGALFADSGVWPYDPILKRGFQAMRVSVSDVVRLDIHEVGDIWQPVRTDQVGVTLHKEGKSYDGYTLYTSGHGTEAFLIDMKGEVVHTWDVPFEKAYPKLEHVSNPIGKRVVYFRRAHVYPNGDLLAIYEGYGDTPWGLGLVKADKDSNVLWSYAQRVHHDLEVADDGTITTMTHRMRDIGKEPVPLDVGLDGWVVEDWVVQLDADGNELRRVNLFDVLVDSEFSGLIGRQKFPDFEAWDPLHANDTSVIGPGFASHYDFAEPGMVLVSMRTIDLIVLLDLEAEKVVWGSRGIWDHQHDPDPLEDGWMLVFDNFGSPSAGGRSRVIEYHPTTGAVRWQFEGKPGEFFESLTRSVQQLLPNGNVMIVESDGARILEVMRDGTAVWAFRNPARRNDNTQVAIIADATRIGPNYLQFKP